jgi:formate hydrogenlyase subunit 3/multisubunit Na+/H+ antiporter MnhD subunit
MITAFIFFAHFLFALVIFTIKWQNENIKTAFLNVILIVILFSVGWSITGILSKFFMEPEGFGIYFDRDTFSLVLLTIGEIFFYKFYYKPEITEKEEISETVKPLGETENLLS